MDPAAQIIGNIQLKKILVPTSMIQGDITLLWSKLCLFGGKRKEPKRCYNHVSYNQRVQQMTIVSMYKPITILFRGTGLRYGG